MKLQTEYHRMEIISGARRPIRSAIQPAATAPKRRIHKVSVTDQHDKRQRRVELLGDRHQQDQEDGEVERVQRPAQPGGDEGVPLIFGRFSKYLIRHRERVVSKDDLLASIWDGRIV